MSLSFSSEPPSPPEDLEVTEVHRDSVIITWKHSKSDGGSPITNYIIEKREAWKTSWAHVDRVRGAVTSAEVIYLQEGTSYNIRVLAENIAGLSEPAELDEAVVPKSPYSELLLLFFSSSDFLFCILYCFLQKIWTAFPRGKQAATMQCYLGFFLYFFNYLKKNVALFLIEHPIMCFLT